jgi:hypothetical protein
VKNESSSLSSGNPKLFCLPTKQVCVCAVHDCGAHFQLPTVDSTLAFFALGKVAGAGPTLDIRKVPGAAGGLECLLASAGGRFAEAIHLSDLGVSHSHSESLRDAGVRNSEDCGSGLLWDGVCRECHTELMDVTLTVGAGSGDAGTSTWDAAVVSSALPTLGDLGASLGSLVSTRQKTGGFADNRKTCNIRQQRQL